MPEVPEVPDVSDAHDVPHERPRIVCLCGSLRFGRELAAERTRLTLELAVVLAPEATEVTVTDPDLVRSLGELHLRRIDLADEVRVVNPGGYVGEATRREIAYAHSRGTRVTYLHEPGGAGDEVARSAKGGRSSRPGAGQAARTVRKMPHGDMGRDQVQTRRP